MAEMAVMAYNRQPYNRDDKLRRQAMEKLRRFKELPDDAPISEEVNPIITVIFVEIKDYAPDISPTAKWSKPVSEKIFDAAIKFLGDVGSTLVLSVLKGFFHL